MLRTGIISGLKEATCGRLLGYFGIIAFHWPENGAVCGISRSTRGADETLKPNIVRG